MEKDLGSPLASARGVAETPERFTPGPWRAERGISDSWNVFYDDKENDFVGSDAWEVAEVHPSCAGSNAKANALLIAAAPDLYEALKEARSEFWSTMHSHMSEEQFLSDPTIKQIDTALAKARGEQP